MGKGTITVEVEVEVDDVIDKVDDDVLLDELKSRFQNGAITKQEIISCMSFGRGNKYDELATQCNIDFLCIVYSNLLEASYCEEMYEQFLKKFRK